jgi:HSP20 family protein
MLTLWKPSDEWFSFGRELDRWFDEGPTRGPCPAVDIEEEENRFVLRADLPGVDEKDLEVRVHEGVLILGGKRTETREEQRGGGVYRERSTGSFSRQFRLGPGVDDTKIEASYKNGVLTVVLPKQEAAKPRQIPVQAA